MPATGHQAHPLPASAESRATKADRVRFLEAWAMENPLATNEAAREAVRVKFGLSLGSEAISKTMRMARDAWETQRQKAMQTHTALTPPAHEPLPSNEPTPELAALQARVLEWAQAMKAMGVCLIEIMPDGRIRFEISA